MMNRLTQRIASSFLLLVSLGYVVCARKRVADPKIIAIVQMAKLGDMVCTTPLFRAIRMQYPNAHIIVFGNAINREVLSGNPHITEYVVLDKSLLHTYTALRAHAIDALCITGPSFDVLAAAIIARIPLIVVPHIKSGWSPYVTIPYRILSRFVTTRPHHMGSYAPREYLRLLEPLNINTDDTRKEVFFSELAKNTIAHLWEEQGSAHAHTFRIGILPGAGNEIKAWAPEKFASLMTMIAEYAEVTFVLLGSEKDMMRSSVILGMLAPNVRVRNYIGKFSLDELKACVDTLNMVIGSDTGPQYIAEALGIPTIDIVGPCDEREQPPMGTMHRIVKVERERAQLYVMNARVYDEKEAKRQVEAISAEMVFSEFKKLFEIVQR